MSGVGVSGLVPGAPLSLDSLLLAFTLLFFSYGKLIDNVGNYIGEIKEVRL